MRDNEIDWEAEFGTARIRVRGASDDAKVATLIEQGQKTIADAIAADTSRGKFQSEALDFAKEAFPKWLATRTPGGDGAPHGDGPCMADMTIEFLMTVARKGWKVSIDTDEETEEWVVEAVHPEHGETTQRAAGLFEAMDLLGGDLRSHLQSDDA